MSSTLYVALGVVAIIGGVATIFDVGGISTSMANYLTRAVAINPQERRTRVGRWLGGTHAVPAVA